MIPLNFLDTFFAPSGKIALTDLQFASPNLLVEVPTSLQISSQPERQTIQFDSQNETVNTTRELIVEVTQNEILIIDADLYERGEINQSLDGMADFVFWGDDAEKVARRTGAEKLELGWGWHSVALQEAILRSTEVEMAIEEEEWDVECELRPHSPLEQLKEQMRKNHLAVIQVGEATLCGTASATENQRWIIYRDVDAEKKLIRLHVEVQSPGQDR